MTRFEYHFMRNEYSAEELQDLTDLFAAHMEDDFAPDQHPMIAKLGMSELLMLFAVDKQPDGTVNEFIVTPEFTPPSLPPDFQVISHYPGLYTFSHVCCEDCLMGVFSRLAEAHEFGTHVRLITVSIGSVDDDIGPIFSNRWIIQIDDEEEVLATLHDHDITGYDRDCNEYELRHSRLMASME